MMGNGIIALGNSLAPVSWHFRVNFSAEDTSVLVHPCQREGEIVLKRCYKEHIICSVACRGDTRGPKYSPETKSEGLHHTI